MGPACSLFSLLVCICLSRPAHPPKVKYSLSQLLLWLALSARIQWPFRTSTPSQREIFSVTAVIVACSLCSCVFAFQDQHTLPKRNILCHSCYCGLLSLLVYSGLSGPAHPPKEKYSLSQLLLWLALSAHVYWPFKTSTLSQREIFSLTAVIVACSLCSYTVAFQDQHTLPKRNILSHSCYCGLLSLLMCIGLSRPAHTPKEKYSLTSCYCGLFVCSSRKSVLCQFCLEK